ncbi:transferase [Caballeronia hypogeia]|uniref:Transferase n=1 Tax=Caballeronia hypogeia TaxID=1777140 RepID=A0A158C3W7_9BURK|nr:glycosyltransferase family 9 protein [Caballeronia hypogeia]SAK76586.1 transferase [Caballeronia hypogeia]
MKLRNDRSVAVVLPSPIGDSLIGLVLVNNLILNGYRPVVFGWVAEQLADWFPHVTVGRPGDWQHAFDTVLELRPTDYARNLSRTGETLCLSTLSAYGGHKHMVDRVVEIATNVLGLRDVTRSNGLVVPADIGCGRFADRVVIHPTGSHPEKMWGREKFLALARVLTRRQLQPSFLVAPTELGAWGDIGEDGHEVNALVRLDEVAKWIAESAWFIGNDSGLGHLASCIGVPTLTLFMRQGLARSWRPDWGPGAIVLPPSLLPFGGLRERLWQRLLTVRRVTTAFETLRGKHARVIRQHAAADFGDANATRMGMLPGAQSRRM